GAAHQGGDPLRRRLILVALFLTVTIAALLGARRLSIRAERQDGLRLARAGRFAEAEPLLQRALERNSGGVQVLSALALGKLGEPDAEDYLSRWCELCPAEARPFRLRMDLRHRTGRGARAGAERLRLLGQALGDGQRVLELEPDNDEVR